MSRFSRSNCGSKYSSGVHGSRVGGSGELQGHVLQGQRIKPVHINCELGLGRYAYFPIPHHHDTWVPFTFF